MLQGTEPRFCDGWSVLRRRFQIVGNHQPSQAPRIVTKCMAFELAYPIEMGEGGFPSGVAAKMRQTDDQVMVQRVLTALTEPAEQRAQ
jgi:hypothetical protein